VGAVVNRAMPTHLTTPDETMARLDATLSKEEQQMLLKMIVGYQNGLGIMSTLAVESDRLTHIVCTYPMDVVRMLSSTGPLVELPDRLRARGCIVVVVEQQGTDVLAIAYPLTEALRLAKIWRDGAEACVDKETMMLMASTSGGRITGTLEVM
jgi:hypothetical protein